VNKHLLLIKEEKNGLRSVWITYSLVFKKLSINQGFFEYPRKPRSIGDFATNFNSKYYFIEMNTYSII